MKTRKWLSLFVAFAMAVSMTAVFAGCGGKTDDSGNTGTGGGGGNTGNETQITVTWYDGRNELKTEKINKGSKATEWTPTKENATFQGWFAEASLSTKFDFSKALSEDTDIYSKWLSNEFVADTNEYYLVGSGVGDMSASNWAQEYKPEMKLTKDTTADKANIYTIEITLYAGDELQIVHSPMTNNDFWDGQMGIGYFKGCEKNSNDTADPQHYVVKDSTGAIVFQAAKGFGDSPNGWNAKLAEGKDGKYEIKLTTYPSDASNNVIEFRFIEGIQALEKTHDMAFIGINGWDEEGLVAMSESDDKATWIGFIEAETEVVFKVYNKINKKYIGGSEDGIIGTDTGITIETEGMGAGNIHLPAGKTYGVRYTVATDKVEVEVCAYYLVGTFLDGETPVNFAVKKGVTPELTGSDGTYAATFTATDVTTNSNYSWIKTQNKPGVFAIKVVLGCELGVKVWYADDAHGGDNFYVVPGEHTVTLTIDDEGKGTVKVV